MNGKKIAAAAALTLLFGCSACFAVACGPSAGTDDSASYSAASEEEPVVTLDRTSASIECWASLTLYADVRNTEEILVWSSSDPSIASVDGGVVSALKVGEAVITATAGGASATCEITVTESTVAPVLRIDQTEIGVYEGESYVLAVRADWNNEPVD